MVAVLVKSTLETRLSSNVKSGPTSKGFCRTFSTQPGRLALQLVSRTLRQGGSEPSTRKTSVPPRFGVCCARAARSRDGEERDGDRRSECSGANHELTR